MHRVEWGHKSPCVFYLVWHIPHYINSLEHPVIETLCLKICFNKTAAKLETADDDYALMWVALTVKLQ